MVRLSQSQSGPLLIHITGFVTRVARRVAQELLEHMSLPSVFTGVSVAHLLVLCVVLIDHCFLVAIALSVL
jgi:hypothetical protein